MSARPEDESGIMVYPRMPVPAARRDEAPHGARTASKGDKKRGGKGWIALLVLGMAAGGAAVWFVRPLIMPDARIADANARAAAAETAAASQKSRADALEQSLDTAAKGKQDVEAKLVVASAAQSELAGKIASEASVHQAAEDVAGKLRPLIDKAWGQVALDGDDVHVEIADRMLWKPNDDALTDRGQALLGKLAGVLQTLPARHIVVAGHTDDPQVAQAKAPPPPAPASKKKPAHATAPGVAAVRFATGWELSAARALAVVHYLQDVAKLDPGELSAQAFGPLVASAKKDRTANRRLELVIAAPKPASPPGK
jgi:chemotaxis protein MotB